MTQLTSEQHRAEALRLLESATAEADAKNFEHAEVLLSLSEEHMAHFSLIKDEERTDEMIQAVQVKLLSMNDPAGPHGPGCTCGEA